MKDNSDTKDLLQQCFGILIGRILKAKSMLQGLRVSSSFAPQCKLYQVFRNACYCFYSCGVLAQLLFDCSCCANRLPHLSSTEQLSAPQHLSHGPAPRASCRRALPTIPLIWFFHTSALPSGWHKHLCSHVVVRMAWKLTNFSLFLSQFAARPVPSPVYFAAAQRHVLAMRMGQCGHRTVFFSGTMPTSISLKFVTLQSQLASPLISPVALLLKR